MTNKANPTVADRVNTNVDASENPLRVIIVGGGIAGVTLAALLHQRGISATIIERQDKHAFGGYMLGLLPIGGRILNGLNLREAYHEKSCQVRRYTLYGMQGTCLQDFDFDEIIERYGDYRGISRGILLDLLKRQIPDSHIIYNTEVESFWQHKKEAIVHFSDGSEARADLLVAADGIHSQIRKNILSSHELHHWSTGWGGWVLWSKGKTQEHDTYREWWNDGWGMGIYPIKNHAGVFLGSRQGTHDTVESLYDDIQSNPSLPRPFREALEHVDLHNENIFYWALEDYSVDRWRDGRVLLLGDAADGFLPTAGVGASMAMDSASALADELTRATPEHLEYAMSLYESRQYPRVDRAQHMSRNIARFTFVNHKPFAWFRDQLTKLYSVEQMLDDLVHLMEPSR